MKKQEPNQKPSVENSEPKAKKLKTKKVKANKEAKAETKTKKSPKEAKEQEVIQEVVRQQKKELLEKVATEREVKYKYPADCTGTLERKRWRQSVRNELRKLEREMFRIHDENTKEYKEAKAKLEAYQKKTLKETATIA